MDEILITALITVLLLLVQHWFPWGLLLGRELPRLAAYIMGVLAITLPLTGLYVRWSLVPPLMILPHLIAMWVVVGLGGLAVLIAHLVDAIMARIRSASELKEILDATRKSD